MTRSLDTIVIGILLLSSLPFTAHARTPQNYDWNERPEIQRSLEAQIDTNLFPDLTDGSLLFTEFTEESSWDGDQTGYVTVQPGLPIYLTIYYFSDSGSTIVSCPAINLLPHQQVTTSINLPVNEPDGIVYLVAWHSLPAEVEIGLLAASPYGSGDPVPKVAATATFRRSKGGNGHHPWDDAFRLANWNPPVDSNEGLPALVVRVDEEGTVCSKDCTVAFNGSIDLGYDDWGSLGSLVMTGSNGIDLNFELPPDLRYFEVSLVVYGRRTNSFGGSAPGIEAVVNNWSFLNSNPGNGPGSSMQHFFFDISHYLKGGYNLIEIRQPASSSQQWPVERIELWID